MPAQLRDGRQRCRRINVYANVLEEQPDAFVRSLRVTDSREREWIAEERQREGRGGEEVPIAAAPHRCVYFAAWMLAHFLRMFWVYSPFFFLWLAPSAPCMFYGPNIDQDLRAAIILALPPLLFLLPAHLPNQPIRFLLFRLVFGCMFLPWKTFGQGYERSDRNR